MGEHEAFVFLELAELSARLVRDRSSYLLHRGDLLGRVGNHVVVERTVGARLHGLDLDAKTDGAPP